jgi:hypothetical protein
MAWQATGTVLSVVALDNSLPGLSISLFLFFLFLLLFLFSFFFFFPFSFLFSSSPFLLPFNVLYKRVAHISEWPTTKSTYNPENASLPKAPSINEILHSLEIGLLSS